MKVCDEKLALSETWENVNSGTVSNASALDGSEIDYGGMTLGRLSVYFVGRFRNVANVIGLAFPTEQLHPNPVLEQQFRNLFEQPLIGMAFEDMNGKLLEVNSQLCAMLGYTKIEMLTMNCDKFSNP